MPLGKSSKDKLATCHPELRPVIEAAAAGIDVGDLTWAGIHDMTVTCGYRGEAEQNDAVARGVSKTPWPRSKHNHMPSNAVDIAPWPPIWANVDQFRVLHAYVRGIARTMGIELHTIDWDMPHIQRRVP